MSTPAEAAARICADLESISIAPLSAGARERVATWTTGTTPHGADRVALLATPDGDRYLGLLCRMIRSRCGPMLNGALHIHGSKEVLAEHVEALETVLSLSGTFLCNGPPPETERA